MEKQSAMDTEQNKPHLFQTGPIRKPERTAARLTEQDNQIALETLGEGEVEGIVKALIEKAKAGDAMAASANPRPSVACTKGRSPSIQPS